MSKNVYLVGLSHVSGTRYFKTNLIFVATVHSGKN